MLKQTLLILFLVTSLQYPSTALADNPQLDKKVEATITGKVIDADGKGIPRVNVSCFYYKEKDWPYQLSIPKHKTDAEGSYTFKIPILNKPYAVHVGGTRSTFAQSKQFTLKPNETLQIEPLIVRPADKSCQGKIIFEDGQPAANLPYGYRSRSFSCIDSFNPPKTNDKGEFSIDHLLPEELFSFWIFPQENTMCVWKKLDPKIKDHQFISKSTNYIELPSDWRPFSTHEAIALQTTSAENSKIQFTLPNLQNKMISLNDDQFNNKAVLVNIYGSWCGGCQLEIPYLVDFKKKYGQRGLEIIGIAFEFGNAEEQIEAIKKVSQTHKVNYPLLIGGLKEKGNGSVEACVAGLKDFKGYPTTLYIDRNGFFKHIQTGFWIHSEPHKKWQLEQMRNHIESILAESNKENL